MNDDKNQYSPPPDHGSHAGSYDEPEAAPPSAGHDRHPEGPRPEVKPPAVAHGSKASKDRQQSVLLAVVWGTAAIVLLVGAILAWTRGFG